VQRICRSGFSILYFHCSIVLVAERTWIPSGGGSIGHGADCHFPSDSTQLVQGEVYDTAGQTLEALEINVVDSEKDALTAKLTGRGAENKKITIKLKRLEENLTEMSVRVGLLGNKNMSRVICDEITKNLQTTG